MPSLAQRNLRGNLRVVLLPKSPKARVLQESARHIDVGKLGLHQAEWGLRSADRRRGPILNTVLPSEGRRQNKTHSTPALSRTTGAGDTIGLATDSMSQTI
ncbi:hypothetical protein V1264_012883 [Littorina saxatilis]|uniref:Uncharacterized protein n=1 Tax=Littorina saxatilis TaxID=31220 RepID=A0AAN9BXG2_9CAEN